jgi:biliverdin reductase
MERLRAAIVGSGGMGHTRAAHLAHDARCAITCVSSRNMVTGRSLAARHSADFVDDWQDVVSRPDVDAVFVATHNDSHAAVSQLALEAGKHVFVEYPLALRLQDADRLVERARRQGRRLSVGHDQAFVGWHTGIKESAAPLGRVLAVNGILATPSRGGGRSVWRNRNLSGPPFIVGVAYVFHLVDLFGPVDWVEGTSAYDALDDAGYYRTSTSTLTAAFASGGVMQLLYVRGFTVPRDEQEQAMMFENGFISFRGYVSGAPTNEGYLTRVTRSGAQRQDFPAVTLAMAGRMNTERFVDGVLAGAIEDPMTATAREAVAVALGAEQAAQESRRVYLHAAGALTAPAA